MTIRILIVNKFDVFVETSVVCSESNVQEMQEISFESIPQCVGGLIYCLIPRLLTCFLP